MRPALATISSSSKRNGIMASRKCFHPPIIKTGTGSNSSSGSSNNRNFYQRYSPHQILLERLYHCFYMPTNSSSITNKNDGGKVNGNHTNLILALPLSQLLVSQLNTSTSTISTSSSTVGSRYYATNTKPMERSSPTLIMGLGTIALTAKAGQYTIQAYNEWKDNQPPPGEKADKESNASKMSSEAQQEERTKTQTQQGQQQNVKSSNDSGKRENIFAKFFNMNVGAKYYEGGFDDKMTRREAALILGVRESSTAKRIKEAHRKLLILNHPDTGGSTFLAGKINEAKELLLKGK